MMRKIKLIFIPLFIILLFTSCIAERAYTENEILMDTVNAITVYSKDEYENIVPLAFDLIREKSNLVDRYSSTSEIFFVNENASSFPVEVSSDVFDLISFALDMSYETDGVFNIAIGPLVDLWKIGTDEARLPGPEEIEEALPLCDYRSIVLDEENHTVSFLKKGMSIDLGAVAKGWIANEVVSLMKEMGCEKAIVNLGGNVYVIGEKEEGRKWTVGLQNPDLEFGGSYATVDVSDSSVVTSGAYERYFTTEDGTRYHHILDPRTGYPSSSDIQSVSIICADSALADALSTTCFILGVDATAEICDSWGVSAVLLTQDNDIIRL